MNPRDIAGERKKKKKKKKKKETDKQTKNKTKKQSSFILVMYLFNVSSVLRSFSAFDNL